MDVVSLIVIHNIARPTIKTTDNGVWSLSYGLLPRADEVVSFVAVSCHTNPMHPI